MPKAMLHYPTRGKCEYDDRPLIVHRIGDVQVVRDDLIPGGTKSRVLPALFVPGVREYVYASPVQGYAQVALAHCCARYGYKATIFCAGRKERHHLTQQVMDAGGNVVEVREKQPRLSVVTKRARDYCTETGALLLPFGLMDERVLVALAAVARCLPTPEEVWSVAASGTLTKALQLAWPEASVNAVRIGAVRDLGRAIIHTAPEKYEQDAKLPPPYPSCSNYDAKLFRFLIAFASPNALAWNVAG